MEKALCSSCSKVSKDNAEGPGQDEEEEPEEELDEITTDEDTGATTDSEPDWDSEHFSVRHLSWWHARFEVDREERVGCPLAPDLAVLISEGPILNIDEEENTE